MRAHNFSAGPGALPLSVLEEAQQEMLEYRDAGASIIEISHRSAQYTAVADSARSVLKRLMGLGDDWHILFLQGGASMQFFQVPLNFLPPDGVADYINTGEWSNKAIKEAQRVGKVNVAASSADERYTFIPRQEDWKRSPRAAYLHITSNNTIHGTEFAADPASHVPVVCDASSDFLSRPVRLDDYGVIYAGAQKNLGPAGVTVVLLRDSMLESANPSLPTILNYRTHVEKLFNTPPVFAVYMVEKVLRWIEAEGGLAGMEARNAAKANLLYGRLDASEFYRPTARPDSRSRMNVTFRLPTEDLESLFVSEAKKAGLINLKGYRTVGGVRVSLYNAVELASVKALVSFMADFEARNG